jgi:hypothetical protein
MTELDLYKNALIEINKLEAPSMLLEDYNYFINKAIQQYVNKVYNRYDTTQQTTDDLSALKRTAILDIHESEPYMAMERKFYYCDLPTDYLHILNCIVTFNNVADDNEAKKKCNKDDYEANKTKSVLARRLTADQYPTIIINAYLKPTHKRPYFFINQGPNSTKSVLEIRVGDERTKKTPTSAYIDYLKTPKVINLTDDDLENDDDLTAELEFPEYACFEIINEFVKLLLENASDPRLQTNIPINQSIGSAQ